MINIFKVEGMTCSHCVKSVEEALRLLPLDKFHVEIGDIEVEYNVDKITRKQIIAAIEEHGYKVSADN